MNHTEIRDAFWFCQHTLLEIILLVINGQQTKRAESFFFYRNVFHTERKIFVGLSSKQTTKIEFCIIFDIGFQFPLQFHRIRMSQRYKVVVSQIDEKEE